MAKTDPRAAEALARMDCVRWADEQFRFKADAVQARVLRGEIGRGLLNCTRQWGKSTVTALMAVHRAVYREESLIVVVSPSERQSGEFLRKAKRFVRGLKLPVRGDGDNDVSLLLPNGSRLVGLPGKEATVRGFSAVSLMLVDEAARVEDAMYRAVRPMLAVGDGDLWLMSTPFGQRGFFHEEWTKGGAEWTRISVKAPECARIGEKFLESERRSLGERWFRQEYLCEFVATEDGVFDMDLVKRAETTAVKPLDLEW